MNDKSSSLKDIQKSLNTKLSFSKINGYVIATDTSLLDDCLIITLLVVNCSSNYGVLNYFLDLGIKKVNDDSQSFIWFEISLEDFNEYFL